MESETQKSGIGTLIIAMISMLISAASFYYIGSNDAILNQMKCDQLRPKYEEIKPTNYKGGTVRHERQKVLMYGSLDNINFFLIDSCYIDEPIYKISK